MITKLTRLSRWLDKNNHASEAILTALLCVKFAANCQEPFSAPSFLEGHAVTPGARGSEVGYIQTLLTEAGYPLQNFGIDCIFGPETEGAIKRFQADNELEESGTINEVNIALLKGVAPLAANTDSAEQEGRTNARVDVPEIQIDGDVFEASNGDKVFPLRPNEPTHLVVFYHGTTGQGPVLEQLGSVGAGTTFLIPNGAGQSYEQAKDTILELQNNHGVEISGKSLGGWSAGSRGFVGAIGKDEFEQLMLADPSPNNAIMGNTPSGVYMEYNANNWTGEYAYLGLRFPELARKIEANGGTAKKSTGHHTPILKSILDKMK